ncbi:MAG: amino acid permease [Anaerolineales bacterium]|nr:amino acid permease [Anaerolineales bacterium]
MKNSPASNEDTSEQVSLFGAIAIGVGGMVGGGIFAVLGLAVELAGGAVPISFLIAGLIALVTAYSYAKLSVVYPSKGGTVIFVDQAFGINFLTGSTNNLLWVSYIVTLALYAVAFGNYAATFLPDSLQSPWLNHILISVGIILPMLLNLLSASLISKTETYVVIIKIAILLLVIVAGFSAINPARLTPNTWKPLPQLFGAGMIIFVAYEGFELIANTAQSVKNYRVTLPRAYYGAVIFVIILYVLIAIVTAGSLTSEQVKASSDFALAAAAQPALGQFGFTLVAVSAVLATFSAINATLYGSARLSYVIATEGELPAFLEDRVWNQPVVGLLITTALALLLANIGNITQISTMASAGFLIIFGIVNAANFILAEAVGSHKLLAGFGVLACAAALITLCWSSYQSNPIQLVVLVAMVGVAMMMELLYIVFWKSPGKLFRLLHPYNR